MSKTYIEKDLMVLLLKFYALKLYFVCWNSRPSPPQEEELRKSGEAKYAHLSNDLHVLIEVFAPPGEAYSRMSHALEEIKKFLVPVSLKCPIFHRARIIIAASLSLRHRARMLPTARSHLSVTRDNAPVIITNEN